MYAKNVAEALGQAVNSDESTLAEECPICLDKPTLDDAVLTPCAHLFCRKCLLSVLPSKGGLCPCCQNEIQTEKLIAFDRQGRSSHFLGEDVKQEPSHQKSSARCTLESALRGADSSKLSAILTELRAVWEQDPGSKILVFSQFLGFLDLLAGSLRKEGIAQYRLDGKMRWKDRVSVLEEFQQRPCQQGSVLLISMKAGGVGVNLVAASSVFIVDPWWNAAVEDQCINRIHRIGQTAPVVRVRKFVVQDSVEERIVDLQRRKKQMAGQILRDFTDNDDDKGEIGKTTPTLEDLKLLFGS